MEHEDYNGWRNRWALVLHINNDQGLQAWALDLTEELVVDTAPRRSTVLASRSWTASRRWSRPSRKAPSRPAGRHGHVTSAASAHHWAEVGESFIEAIDA